MTVLITDQAKETKIATEIGGVARDMAMAKDLAGILLDDFTRYGNLTPGRRTNCLITTLCGIIDSVTNLEDLGAIDRMEKATSLKKNDVMDLITLKTAIEANNSLHYLRSFLSGVDRDNTSTLLGGTGQVGSIVKTLLDRFVED